MDRQKIAEYTQLLRPWSVAAFALAFLAIAVATVLRSIFAYFGATLNFATYFPVVLVVSVFAGVPAGAATAVLSMLVVWWAFIPPYYAFSAFQTSDYANFALYSISAGLIIGLSHLYRTTLFALLQTQRAKDLLVHELNHRAGNLLTVIQAIVKGTLKNYKQEANSLSGRIEALARADDFVSRSADCSASLEVLLQNETAPYGGSVNINLKGPPVFLNGTVTRNVALVLHELTTNSVKYGALSSDRGELDITWSVIKDRCVISWIERNGPHVEKPIRKGFGTQMILASLQTLHGTIEQSFDVGGYRCDLAFKWKICN